MYKNALNLPQNSLKASVHFPKTGGGVKFLKFIRQEVFVQSIEAHCSCAILYLGFINLCLTYGLSNYNYVKLPQKGKQISTLKSY